MSLRAAATQRDRKGEMGLMPQVLGGEYSLENNGKKSIVTANDLCVYFAKSNFLRAKSIVKAIDNVSFSLYDGEILSLVGESGSGKSTIARCLMKLQAPTSGQLTFDTVDLSTISDGSSLRNYRRQVQMIYQDPFESLNPRDDVFTTISNPIRLLRGVKDSKRVKEIVSELLVEVGLKPDEVMTKFPHQLSGGERQRVNIARALAPNPKLLVADEPITMLDASQRLKILSLLMKLKYDRNLSILLITHDLASAKVMSDRCIIMLRGRAVEMGSTDLILSRPHHPYTQLILDTVPKIRMEKRSFADRRYLAEEPATGCVFRLRCKYATSICEKVDPRLENKSNSHLAACHNPLNLANT
jgi:oligopeptide/dipeptide ABC transporter ATP-binding protein